MIDDNEVSKMLDEVNLSIFREAAQKSSRKNQRDIQKVLDTLAVLMPENLSQLSPASYLRYQQTLSTLLYGWIESQVSIVNYLQAAGVDLANDEKRTEAILEFIRMGAERFNGVPEGAKAKTKKKAAH